jgi:dTDP-4-dehydrorhamnose reductase
MRILFTGVSGLLGKYFVQSLAPTARAQVWGAARREHAHPLLGELAGMTALPFEDLAGYRRLVREFRPEAIVHAGAEGNVDTVEKAEPTYESEQLDFVAMLLEESRTLDAKLVHFSSNAIYGGDEAPYSEAAHARPLHRYGRLKAALDQRVRESDGNWMILRPTVAYGWNFADGRKNPVSQFAPLLQAGKALRVVTDQFENPVYAGDVAAVLARALERDFRGELNVGGGDRRVSRFDWIRAVAAAFGAPDALVAPAVMADFPSLIARPEDTSFDIQKLRAVLGYEPLTVAQGAARMCEAQQTAMRSENP